MAILRACVRSSLQAVQAVVRMPTTARKAAAPLSCAALQSPEYASLASAAEDSASSVFETIPFGKAEANSVSIIGNLGNQPELRTFATGSQLCQLAVAINKKDDPPAWVDVDIWGDYAETCVQHLSKGQKICVHGRLKVDKWTDKVTQQARKKLQVVGHKVMLVAAGTYEDAGDADAVYDDYADTETGYQGHEQTTEYSGSRAARSAPSTFTQRSPQWTSKPKAESSDPSWDELARDPNQFWDNRQSKYDRGSPRAPDYVNKTTKAPLWLNSAPGFIREDPRFTPYVPPFPTEE